MLELLEVKEGRFVSLDKIANVNILPDKTVLNMSYSIRKDNQYLSDYYYTDLLNDAKIEMLLKSGFIHIKGEDREAYINPKHLSGIKFIPSGSAYTNNLNKIIFLFSHDVGRADNTFAEYMSIVCDDETYKKFKTDIYNDTSRFSYTRFWKF